jgi:glyoxylase-like metal-dependent hydrolase (beta-lactamase superfamily II)
LTIATDHISVRELQDLMTAGQPVNIVDIRSPADVEWTIPGSTHVDAYGALQSGGMGPLAELTFTPGPVVTVCGIGQTAAIATRMLRARGVEASTLEGGMRAWSLAWNTAQAKLSGCEIVQVRRTGKGCLSYIIESESEAIIIDASVDVGVYTELLRKRMWRLVSVIDTHIHADHVSRSRMLAKQEGVDLWLPAQERARFRFRPVLEGDRIPFGSAHLDAFGSPGHTEESTSYLIDRAAAFTGDTLFLGGVGRPDLEGGTREERTARARLLHASVARLLGLPDETLVLPGHVSEPIAFDGHLLATTVRTIRETVALTSMDREAFVGAVLARIPAAPPNHSVIVELNERGDMPEDPSELEAGANRCAVA